METTNEIIEAELEVWGVELLEALRDKLKDKKVEHGGGQAPELLFENNLNIVLNFSGGEYSWVVNMKEYWKYLEYGTKGGGWMPKEKVKDWITLKGLNPSSIIQDMRIKSLQSKGKNVGKLKPLSFAKALPQLTYILQRSIFKKGTSQWQQKNFGKKSTDFISETLGPKVEELAKRIERKMALPVIAIIKEELEN